MGQGCSSTKSAVEGTTSKETRPKTFNKREETIGSVTNLTEIHAESLDDLILSKEKSNEFVVKSLQKTCIGSNVMLKTPFGDRVMTYCDYTASGRLLEPVEDFMRHAVAPMYANTHTESSATGLQTTHFREEARALIMETLGADPSTYACLFCGTGMTGAVHKLIGILEIRTKVKKKATVFVGPAEHHSNEVSWRECHANVIEIPEVRATGQLDISFLKKELEKLRSPSKRGLLILSISAGSNVSGIKFDLSEATKLVKEKGGLVFVDYAAAGPYVEMKMTPKWAAGHSLDAIFLSPHKFPGGPGSAGILVVKRSLVTNEIPTQPGGGTVSFVSPWHTDYLSSIENREDGGTPGILQAIRAGLRFIFEILWASKKFTASITCSAPKPYRGGKSIQTLC